jgi:hypothetical protein
MSKHAASPFQQPAEKALSAALASASARQQNARFGSHGDPAIVLPDLTTGKGDEESSRAMNDVMTDVEAKFDEIYLNYPRHKQMQLAIDRIRLHGSKVKGTGKPMRGLLVTGPTGSGKTTGIEEYVAYLIRDGAYAEGRMPVLYLRLRKKVTVIKLLRAILSKFGDRYALRRDEDQLIEQVRNCIERAGVEVIVIDECQHLRNKSTDNLEVTDQLKTFLDDCIAPVVFVGVKEAQAMFDENLQLAGRCGDPVELTALNSAVDADVALLTRFLDLLDKQMVERQLTSRSSSLSSPYTVTCLHLASAGVIGQAYRIVRAALLIATSRGALFVETYDLSLAVERWAMRNKVCTSNPFLRADLQAAYLGDPA